MLRDETMLNSNTPVLAGVGACMQRLDDPRAAREPLELMAEALRNAAQDAGSEALLSRADLVAVPRGFWEYNDPGRALAEGFGAPGARSVLAEVGVLQSTLPGLAAQEIAAGRSEVVLLAGGEARYRSRGAARLGTPLPEAAQQRSSPDQTLRPQGELLHPLEVSRGVAVPVVQYAMIENALRHAEGQSPAAHRAALDAQQAALSEVAAANPHAWRRSACSPAQIRAAPPQAYPYTRLHCSDWNVDQAAGLILCSLEVARALGVPRERLVFPWVVAEANVAVPLCRREAVHRSPGFAAVARLAAQHCGTAQLEASHRELYSCFPSALRVQQREFGFAPSDSVSVTGGMCFAGGPLNNFVLQGLVSLAAALRAAPGEAVGLSCAVSGMLTKQGISLWSPQEPPAPFAFLSADAQLAREGRVKAVSADARGDGVVTTYTVLYQDETPVRLVALVEMENGERTLAGSEDRDWAAAWTQQEGCGARVGVRASKLTRPASAAGSA